MSCRFSESEVIADIHLDVMREQGGLRSGGERRKWKQSIWKKKVGATYKGDI